MKIVSTYIWRSSFIATVLTFVGWGASRFGQVHSTLGAICALVGLLLLLPGQFVAAEIAMIFSAQGGHGMGNYLWIVAPVSWFVYFLVFAFARLSAPSTTPD